MLILHHADGLIDIRTSQKLARCIVTQENRKGLSEAPEKHLPSVPSVTCKIENPPFGIYLPTMMGIFVDIPLPKIPSPQKVDFPEVFMRIPRL